MEKRRILALCLMLGLTAGCAPDGPQVQADGGAEIPAEKYIAITFDDGPHRETTEPLLDGLLERGVVIRHLLLPGALENTKAVLDWIAGTFPAGSVLVSLMSQYTPQAGAEGLLRRKVTGAESRAARAYMENLGLTAGYYQDSSSAREEYTPPFDLTGV